MAASTSPNSAFSAPSVVNSDRYTLDQVLAAVQIVRPGFGDGLGPEQAQRLAAPLRDEAVRFLDALNPSPSSSAPPGAAASVVNSDLPDEREFIRQAVAVFEMLELRKLRDGDNWALTIRHGANSTQLACAAHRLDIEAAIEGNHLLEAFFGLAEGCVREGRKIVAAYDAQRGTP